MVKGFWACVITGAMTILIRDFGPYGIIFMTAFTTLHFTVIRSGQCSSLSVMYLSTLFSDRLCGLVVSVCRLQTQRSRVRFPGTPYNFSEGVGSGTGSTQPRDRIN
jgi:hypothetical protein